MNASLSNRILNQLEQASASASASASSLSPDRKISEKTPREWSNAVLAALVNLHRNDRAAILHHARSIIFNLKRNGRRLIAIPPEELATLRPEDLADGTEAFRRRKVAELGGWDAPTPRRSDEERDLAVFGGGGGGAGSWSDRRRYGGKELVLVLNDDAAYRAFVRRFRGRVERVTVVKGDITAVEGRVDAYVSPSNIIGNMDGGIDKAYAEHFGWSYGRPYHEPNPLQLAIDVTKGQEGGVLPIGEAIVVRTESVNLIAAPTMALPGKIPVGSRVVYKASRAAFLAWKGADDIDVIRVPAFGTGWGQVPAEVAAWQMWEAFVHAWS